MRGKRYMIISWRWNYGQYCTYGRRTAEMLTRREYVAEVLAVKYGH
jgi:hypothetical protein